MQKNYSVVYIHDQPLAGRGMKKDPFHEELEKSGCYFEEKFGWERPGWFNDSPTPVFDYDWYGAYDNQRHENYLYRDNLQKDYTFEFPKIHNIIKNESLTCRNSVALFNMSYFGKIYISGPDAPKAVDWIFTQNMDGKVGDTKYSCMLNKFAGIEADLTVSLMESGSGMTSVDPSFEGNTGYYVATAGGSAYHNFAHIQQTLQDKGLTNIKLQNVSRDIGLLSIQGPKSKEILEKITNKQVDWSNEAFPFGTHKLVDIKGYKCRALRVSFVGELGWELHIPKESCLPIYKILHSAGECHGLINAGYRAIDSLSLEKGYPHWHAEIRSNDTPLEAGLMFTCKMKSGVDFLGRESLKSQMEEGPRKRKACFTLENNNVMLLGNESIWRNGECVGFVRRGDYGFFLDKSMAYGYISNKSSKVSLKWLKEGEYEIEKMGLRYKANYHPKSPFDPDNRRIMGNY